MCLAKNIRYLRKKYNYSQDYMAEILGYKSYTTIQKWEMGISEPSIAKLKQLSEIFQVDINDMTSKKLYSNGYIEEEKQLEPKQINPSVYLLQRAAEKGMLDNELDDILSYAKYRYPNRFKEDDINE